MGEPAVWDRAEAALRAVLEKTGRPFQVDEGGGRVLRPEDRPQDQGCARPRVAVLDLPARLPAPGAVRARVRRARTARRQRPIMIHRALLGSMERFIAVLIEHFAGAFPLWLAPVQARVLTVSEKAEAYAQRGRHAAARRGAAGRGRPGRRQAGRQDSARPAGEDPLHARRRRKRHGGARRIAPHPRRVQQLKDQQHRRRPGGVRGPPARGGKNARLRDPPAAAVRHYNDGSSLIPELTTA